MLTAKFQFGLSLIFDNKQLELEYIPKFMAKHFIKKKTVIIKRIWKWTFNATWNMDINSLKELCGILNPSFDTNLS